jgi:hypothetical protein
MSVNIRSLPHVDFALDLEVDLNCLSQRRLSQAGRLHTAVSDLMRMLEVDHGSTSIRGVLKSSHRRIPAEEFSYDFTLNADAAPVDDADLTVASKDCLVEVFLHQALDLRRREGVQIDPVLNGHFDRFVRQAASLTSPSPDNRADPAKVDRPYLVDQVIDRNRRIP